MTERQFLYHEPCEKCGSSNNVAVYEDGYKKCFTEGCGFWERGDGEFTPNQRTSKKVKGVLNIGEHKSLSTRKISKTTCKKYDYRVGKIDGKTCQIANYRDASGNVVAQKLRFADKTFACTGNMKDAGLYGEHLFKSGGRMIVVTEGEIDTLSVSQAEDNQWPVVSLPNGAAGAPQAIKKSLQFLESFENVIFMFDMDDPGREAANKCAALLSPGKAKIASLPRKDANEMLVAGDIQTLVKAKWQAKEYRPDGIVSGADLIGELQKPVTYGLSYPWEELTRITYGIRTSELIALGAGTGMGKTELFKEIANHLIFEHKKTVGMLMLEERPEHTWKGVMSKRASKLFHLPDAGWTQEEFEQTNKELTDTGRLFLYDSFGYTDYEIIKSTIRYMAVSLDCHYIFLDHITALVSGDKDGDERKQLDYVMTDLASLARELDICIFFISHLSTPEGKPHEEGGRVMIKHFRGSRAIGQWASFMFGLERDQQHKDDNKRKQSVIRCLKDRYSGRGTGETFLLNYDSDTGRLTPAEFELDDDEDEDDGDFEEADI
jgi:twinkle protein